MYQLTPEQQKLKDEKRMKNWLAGYNKFENEVKGIKKVCKSTPRNMKNSFAMYNMANGEPQ